MQQQVNVYNAFNIKISDTDQLLNVINNLFICYLPKDKKENLHRLENKEARNFYSMLLGWRTDNKSYSEMIALFVGYWSHLVQQNKDTIVYVGKWGDLQYPGSNAAHYTDLKIKTEVSL